MRLSNILNFKKTEILRILVVVLGVTAVITAGNTIMNTAYADTPKEIFDKAAIAAETEFSETILKAKSEYNEIRENPEIDSETKMQAQKEYNKIVADAKIIRDQKIEQARQEYQQAIASETSLSEARNELLQTINAAKLEYEKHLEEAQTYYEESLLTLTDNEGIEALEEKYKKILEEIKQLYNETVALAHQEYQKILKSINGGEQDA